MNGKWEWERGSRGSPPSISEDIREFLSLYILQATNELYLLFVCDEAQNL